MYGTWKDSELSDIESGKQNSARTCSLLTMSSSSSSRTTTVFTVAAVTVLGGLAAYAVYFDYKRRNDGEFRKKLRTWSIRGFFVTHACFAKLSSYREGQEEGHQADAAG